MQNLAENVSEILTPSRFHTARVYTSRGTGYWGPPKRFGAPSEITLITLRSAA